MSQQLLTMSYITNEALVVLENELVLANRVERQYSGEFAKTGAKIGNTVNIRRPPRYIGTYGPPLNVEDTYESYVPVVLNYQFHVDVQFTAQDLALSMDMFKKRILKPQIAAVANRVDNDTSQYAYQNTQFFSGIFGTLPATYKIFSDARAILAGQACPADGEKNCILEPYSMSAAVDGVKGLFNPQAQLGEWNIKGMIAKNFAGLDWFEDQNIPTINTGSAAVAAGGTAASLADVTGSAHLTSGWAQQGTIDTQGWAHSTAVLNVGDIIQFVGTNAVYPVNPQSRMQVGKTPMSFVVLPPGGYATPANGAANPGLSYAAASLAAGTFNPATGQYTSNSSGALTVTIGGCIISGGQFQNATNQPTTSSSISVNGNTNYVTTSSSVASPQGLVFHKYAVALAFADLPLPQGVEMAARAYDDEDVGMSIRLVTQYTINNDSEPTRADVLYGPASLYRELAVRIPG